MSVTKEATQHATAGSLDFSPFTGSGSSSTTRVRDVSGKFLARTFIGTNSNFC